MTERQAHQQRRAVPRWLIIVSVLVLALAAIYGGYRWSLQRAIAARLDAIRADGYPATLAELQAAYPMPPPEENAAFVYQEAFELLVSDPDLEARIPAYASDIDWSKFDGDPYAGEAWPEPYPTPQTKWPAPGKPYPGEMLDAMTRYVELNQPAIDKLHEAAAMERCRFPVDLLSGDDMKLFHLGKLRHSARLLAVASRLHNEKENRAEHVHCLRSILGVAGSLRDEPIYASQLVLMQIETIFAETVIDAVHRTAFTDSHWRHLQDTLKVIVNSSRARLMLISEFCLINHRYTHDHEAILIPESWIRFAQISGVMDINHITSLNLMKDLLEAAELPGPQRIKRGHELDAAIDAQPVHQAVTRFQLGALAVTLSTDLQHSALMHASDAALAIERFRLAEGRLPDSLDELAPAFLDEVPVDPFDGQPLRYRRLDDGYVVYSVGTDGQDDGGQDDGHSGSNPGTDIAFTVNR